MTNEQLVERIQSGDHVAENMLQLWEQNCNFIKMMASQYRGQEEPEDLQQEGYIGLCRAVDDYDPASGVPFINYAALWIRQGMVRYIENCGSVVRVPVHARKKLREYNRLSDAYQKETGRKPSDRQMRRYFGEVQCDTIEYAKRVHGARLGSLDAPVSEEDGETMLCDLVAGAEDTEATVLDEVQQQELEMVIWPVVDTLTERQADAIRLRYREGMTWAEAGRCMGISLNAVREHEKNALRELRWPSRARLLRPFLYYDEIHNRGMQGTGVARFNQSWTSATERVSLDLSRL